MGAEWALNNPTYTHMNSWFHYAKLYAATAGCIGSVSYTHLDVYKRQSIIRVPAAHRPVHSI